MSIQQKQEYLYKNIIEGGYDPVEFQAYLSSVKQDGGMDIQVWSMDELREVVTQFKSLNSNTGQYQSEPEELAQAEPKQDKSAKKQQQKPEPQPKVVNKPEASKTGSTQSKPESVATDKPTSKQAENKTATQLASPSKVQFGKRIPIKTKDTKPQPAEPPKNIVKPVQQKPEKKEESSPQAQPVQLPSGTTKPQVTAVVSSTAVSATTTPKQITITTTENKKIEQEPTKKPQQPPLQSRFSGNSAQSYQDYDHATNEQIFSKVINCQRKEATPLFLAQNVTVQIKGFERVEGGIFEQAYINYLICTPSQKWQVRRRYNQFQWLRDTLEKMHPGLPVPPIAKKGTHRKFDETHLAKRGVVLENFLNKLLSMPELKADPVLEQFLSNGDFVSFLKFKKDNTIVDNKIRPEKLRTLNGRISMVIEPKITKFTSLAKHNLATTEHRLLKIYKQSKQIETLILQQVQVMNSVSNTFGELSSESKLFNQVADIEVKSSAANYYSIMKNLTSQWADTLVSEANLIKKYLYEDIRYQYFNLNSLQDALKRHEEVKEEYYQFKNKLRKIKERLYDERAFGKWGVVNGSPEKMYNELPKAEAMSWMLPKQTDWEIGLKEYYALMNFQLYQELSRYYTENPKALAVKTLELSKLGSQNSSQKLMLMADLMTSIMSFMEGKRTFQVEIAG